MYGMPNNAQAAGYELIRCELTCGIIPGKELILPAVNM